MTVDRRLVASRMPKSAGDRGLLRVETRHSLGAVPPPTRNRGLQPIRRQRESDALTTEFLGVGAAV
jgi:hypothetical protein